MAGSGKDLATVPVKATITMLTYNAAPWIDELLDVCVNQQADFDFEVLVIDSGSTDGTVEAIKQNPGVRLHQIPNSNFGHGRTRNLAIELARGEFVLFLTHDALPTSKYWMEQMLKPFELSPDVACVYGKQVPRPDCCATVKRDVTIHFQRFGPDHFVMLQMKNPRLRKDAEYDALTYFSDVNSAVRKRTLQSIPFRDLPYAEDQALGRDVIEAGLIKAYAPLGAVWHSHSYPLRQYFARMCEEMHGLYKATGRSLDTGLAYHAFVAVRDSLKDWKFVYYDRDYTFKSKIKWFIEAPLYQVARRVAIRLMTRSDLPGWAEWAMGKWAAGKQRTPGPAPEPASPARAD